MFDGLCIGSSLVYALAIMIILLSPAKSLDFDSPAPAISPSEPRFEP